MPKCLGAELSRHFGTGAEVSWYRSVLGPKCPVTAKIYQKYAGEFGPPFGVLVAFLGSEEILHCPAVSQFSGSYGHQTTSDGRV